MNLTRMLVEWALSSTLLILVVTALRALLGKRVSAGLRYALWAVVLARLLVPVQLFALPVPAPALEPPGRGEVVESAPPAAVSATPGTVTGSPAIVKPVPDGVVVDYELNAAPVPPPKAEPVNVLQVLGWLWLAGTAAMGLAFVVSNAGFARRLRRVRAPLEGADCPLPVYIAPSLPSPCLFGLLRAGVYVTSETAEDPVMLRHVLAHEHTHFRHGDHVWNILRSVALAVHWWNPLVWLAVILSRRDCELACDEGALKRLGDGERVAYGRTLLALLTVKPRPGDLLSCATTMTVGQKSVFERVTRIAHAPRRLVWAAVMAVLVAVVACVCAFGQEGETEDDPSPPPSAIVSSSVEEPLPGQYMDLLRGAVFYSVYEGEEIMVTMVEEINFAPTERLYLFDAETLEQYDTSRTAAMVRSLLYTSCDETYFYLSSPEFGFYEAVPRGLAAGMGDKTRDYLEVSEFVYFPIRDDGRLACMLSTPVGKVYGYLDLDGWNVTCAGFEYEEYDRQGWQTTYADVLMWGVPFGHMVDGLYQERVSAADIPALFSTDDPYVKVWNFAAVDLDGDGADEVVLHASGVGASTGGYLVLCHMWGGVIGFTSDWRNFWDLKTDGTFSWSSPTGQDNGWASYPDLYTGEMEELSRMTGSWDEPDAAFSIGGESVTQAEYWEYNERQKAKPDVEWHEFTRENIEALLQF